jgi:23S rRNA (adenine2503-C2)-methyltransferase
MQPPSLAGLLPDEIERLFAETSFTEGRLPAYRINQIYRWICSGIPSFEGMNNIPLALRKSLNEQYRISSSSIGEKKQDKDKTVKLQIILEDGNRVEAVILRDGKGRKTACLSVQAGCASGCAFCKTAQLGFRKNLTSLEIAEEFLFLKKNTENEENDKSGITRIVFMGMGEPLLNLKEVRRAVNFFSDKKGLNISRRRITLSTCGIIKGLQEFTDEGPDIRLAISLISARETLRTQLMPISKSNPLKKLKESLLYYQKKRGGRITLEVVLLKGINTGAEDVKALAGFAEGLDTVINLIPWNQVEGLFYKTPSQRETAFFAEALEESGLKVTRRFEKGRSISGACGQLGSLA